MLVVAACQLVINFWKGIHAAWWLSGYQLLERQQAGDWDPRRQEDPKIAQLLKGPWCPLLKGDLEAYRVHLHGIFRCSPGRCVFASIIPAAARLFALVLSPDISCGCLAWWQTWRHYRSCLCLVKADSCLPWDKVSKDERVPGGLCQHLHAGETRR